MKPIPLATIRLFVLVLLCAAISAQSSGAIYTTNRSASVQNGNLFRRKVDVYLAGGVGASAPCSSPGLPDGNYYFQVTNPSGNVLLSEDFIQNRRVVVVGGVISTNPVTVHETRPGRCGSRIVQLTPFANTTSAGDEYKVWLTPVERWDPAGSGFFGFQAKFSKTDNFKVKNGAPSAQSVICGYKFFDHNEDGIWNPSADPLEVPIAGWRVELWIGTVFNEVTFTDESGRYCFIRNQDNTVYTVKEKAPGGFIEDEIPGAIWHALTPRSGTVTASAPAVTGPDFGNLSFEIKPGVGRTKGFWHNENGRALLAACDPQWRQDLYFRNGLVMALRTNISSADPNLSLLIPPYPTPTSPPPAFFALPFVDAHNYFASWIVGNPALGHGGFILSSQIAASLLNNSCGFMQFTAYIDHDQDGVLESFEDLVHHGTALLNETGAGLTGPNDPYQDLRTRMLMCLNEFGSINETGDLQAPQVVYGSSFSPKEFSSPYP
ncbi:MAG TPA: hypothetical protein VFD82_02745 [Planctomycetota bacterium]|nr:hypothetical protein [Planctomycetota bacterium]